MVGVLPIRIVLVVQGRRETTLIGGGGGGCDTPAPVYISQHSKSTLIFI